MPQKRRLRQRRAGPTQYDLDIENATLSKRGAVTLPATWITPEHRSRQFLDVGSSDSASGIGERSARAQRNRFRITSPRRAGAAWRAIVLPTRLIDMTRASVAQPVGRFQQSKRPPGYRVNPDGTPGAEVAQQEPIDPGITAIRCASLNNRR